MNTSYINKGGTTVLGLAFNWTVDNREPVWVSGQAAYMYVCSITAGTDSPCYGNAPFLDIRYNSTRIISPPVARYSVILPDGFFPDMKLTFTDTSTNASTAWVWTATNVSGNNTPFVFARTKIANITLGAGNWLIRHTATNADGSNTTPPAFFNISECSGAVCSHRYYPSNYATIGNTTNSTWSDKRSAVTANSLQEPGTDWYLPVTMPSAHTPGIYGHWTRALLTFPTLFLRDSVTVTRATVIMWGAGKFNSFTTPDASMIDARPADPANYAAGDWGRTSYTRLSPDVAYENFNVTPGKISFVLNNNLYINKTGYTSFYFTNNFVTDNIEPSPWVSDQYAYLFYCDAKAAAPEACKGLYNSLEVTYSLVVSQPVANFTASPRSGTAPLTVRFTDTSKNAPTSWRWTFGDGSAVNSTQKNPVHTYTKAGRYNVSLRATNAFGTTTSVKNRYITITAPVPVVNGITPAAGVRGRLAVISNLSGTGFSTGATVHLNRTGYPLITATNVTVVSARRITCTFAIPAGSPLGLRNVDVKNTDGKLGTRASAFMVRAPAAPTVNALQPNTGRRGTLVTITNLSGTGFVAIPKPRVQLLRNTAVLTATNVTVVNANRITCTFAIPAGAATGLWNASVTNGDNQKGVRVSAFTVTT